MSNFNYATHNTPVNRNAASAMSGGCSYEPQHSSEQARWTAPPKTERARPNSKQLTGQRFGRLVVIGLLPSRKGKKAQWLVRCDCGWYEARTEKRLKSSAVENYYCQDCWHLERLRGRV